MWIRFILYGLGGWCGEILYTGVTGSLFKKEWRLVGTTYLWMFPIYGLIAILYEPVHNLIRDGALLARATVWALGFTLVEWITGWLIARLVGRCPWDYSDRRWALNPYIRLDYLPVWALVGLALEPIHDFLVILTPAIIAAWSQIF